MLGRLLNTLSRRVKAEEREWRSVNLARESYRAGNIYTLMLILSARPRMWTVTLFVIASIAVIVLGAVNPRYWAIHYIEKFDVADRAAYFAALWSIQTGLVALLYPIVIAFVTLLLARERSSSAALPIYLHDSAAQFSGSSALGLVVQMGIQYMWIPYVSDTTLMNWILVDAVWFLLNAAFTIYFLGRTYQFVKPARRFDITKRYLVNVAWPREARRHLASHFWQAAVGEKLLPGPAFGQENSAPSVLLGVRGIEGKHQFTKTLRYKRRLVDVRFRLLAWAIASWLRRARRAPKPQGRVNPFAYVIAFPLDVFSTYEGPISLCMLDGDVKLGWNERILIRCSFVFRRPPKDLVIDLQSSDILSDAQAEANEALRGDDVELFSEQIDRLVELYEALIATSEVLDDTGQRTSLLLLPQSNSLFGDRLSRALNSRFIDLFEAAARKIPVNVNYMRRLTHVPNRLFASAAKGKTIELMKEFIGLSPMLYFAIERWWSTQAESEGHSKQGICFGIALKPPSRGWHNKVTQRFVESWESLRGLMSPRNVDKWKELATAGDCLERHLFHSVALLSTTTVRGDRVGAEWLLDVLVKWYSSVRHWFDSHSNELWRPHFVTVALLKDDWSAVLSRLSELSATVVAEPTTTGVFPPALKNLWRDLCCIAIYIHLLWGKDCECENSLAALVVSILASGKALRGDEDDTTRVHRNADDLLICILRQRYADSRYTEYLNTCIEQLLELAEPEPISGRLYSRYGAHDLDHLSEGQLLALMLAAPPGWSPSTEIRARLHGWAGGRDDNLRDVQRLLAQWSESLRKAEFMSWRTQYDCLKAEGALDFDEHRKALAVQFDALRNELAARREEIVAQADISAERLLQFGRWGSSRAFAKETARFPISAFRKVGVFDEAEDAAAVPNAVSINRMNRGEFTEPLQEQIAVNEDDWIANVVRDHAGALILWNAIHKLAPADVQADTPEKYWTEFKQYVNEAHAKGLHPLLLLENPTIPEWVYEWGNERFGRPIAGRPSDLSVVSKQRPELTGYQFDLNGVPVVSAPLAAGSSILFVLESLESVDFARKADGSFVTASVTSTPDARSLVDLKLAWQVRAQIDTSHRSVRLIYARQEEPPSAGLDNTSP